MKTQNCLSMLLLAIGSLLGLRAAREEVYNEASTCGTHETGIIAFRAEVAIPTRYLLTQKGAAPDGMIVNGADTRPWGVCQDEPALGNKAAVALLGSATGTLKVRAAKAIVPGVKLYTTAGGKVTDTYASGAFLVGIAITSAAADGDLIEFSHCLPLLDASGTTL